MRKYGILVVVALSGSVSAQPSGPPDPGMGQPQQQPPPGSTRATFLSTTGEMQWEVTLDRARACTTPCSIWVEPNRFVALHSHEPAPVRLDVGYLAGNDVVVSAKPLHTGAYVTGITFTTLGGAALVTGITLGAVGCSTNHGGMCTAGVITGLSGAFVTAGSIWLMYQALPEARIGPATPYVGANQVGLAGTF
jgi:hypothetical protein